MIKIFDKKYCCGCRACVQACPKQCLSFTEDAEGFQYPVVDVLQCIDCGLCEKVCPEITPFEPSPPTSVYAAINTVEEIRMQSSSGGVFTILAEQILSEGGVVFGVRFNDKWQAIFDYTESIEGLAAFRGSKYIQAEVGSAYVDVKRFLKTGRKVLFSGTPCQVSALKHFLRREYDNLLCVDIICHGVPSPKVWKMYLEEVTHNAVKAINDVQFRNKTNGWKKFNFALYYIEESQHFQISSWHQQNHYMRIFLKDVILRPSCYECKTKGFRSGSDITIADFWGIQRCHPEVDDNKGTSAVLVNTDKGRQILARSEMCLWDATLDEVLSGNSSLICSAKEHPKRDKFFSELDSCESVTELIDETLKLSVWKKICKFPYLVIAKMKSTLKNGGGGKKITTGDFDSNMIEIKNTVVVPKVMQGSKHVTNVNFRMKYRGWHNYYLLIGLGDG